MKPRVLVSAPYAMPIIDSYRAKLEAAGCEVVVAQVGERLSEEELLPLVGDIDGIICGDDKITERVLAAAPKLKVISKWGTGIDSIDQVSAAKRGVAVRNTPNAFSEPLADHVLGFMLLFARKFDVMDADIRAGRWVKPQLSSLGEATLGIIGVGDCGKAIARRALAFGMRVLGNDIVEMPRNFLAATSIEMTDRESLLRQADFITINTTLNPSSHRLIDDAAFLMIKPTAYLVNCSRGPVVEEAALARALESGRLAGAALDVYENEPLPENSPLKRLKNCWLSPHNANSSPHAAQRVHDNTIRNLLEGLRLR